MKEEHSKVAAYARQSSRNDRPRVAAVVVAHFPDAGFTGRLQLLLPQVDSLVVVDNTPERLGLDQTRIHPCEDQRMHYIANEANLGIATALNQGLTYALEADCEWLVTLDQDTQCYPDMVRTLLTVAAQCKPQPSVIGGNYFDAKRRRHEVPVNVPGDYLGRKTVITSGCLVDAAFAKSIGGFRDDYFIDQVDHEFCLRARAHGGSVVISRKPVMDHSVGGKTGPRLPLLGQMLPDHSALRKYYVARNSIVTIRTYMQHEPVWCLKRGTKLVLGLVGMVIIEQDRLTKLRAFATGILDGARQRMGPSQQGWLGQG